MKNRPSREAQSGPTANSTTTTTTAGNTREPKPWLLPLEHLPVLMHEHGISLAHSWPLIGVRLANGKIRSWRCSPANAWSWPLVEWPRTGHAFVAIVVDCDSPLSRERLADAVMGTSTRAPQPNFVSHRHASGHAQGAWSLRYPVLRGPNARPKPLAMLARAAEWLVEGLAGDRGFAGVLASNPIHREYETVWHRTTAYTLTELRRYVPHGWRRPRPPRTDVGRNSAIFDALVRYAGSAQHSDDAVRQHAQQLYREIDVHQPHSYTQSELADTVRSVLRYRAQWRTQGWYSEEWVARQQLRGKRNSSAQQALKGYTGGIRSGEARRRETQERDERILDALEAGQRPQEIARIERLDESTVRHIRDRHRKSGRSNQHR